MIQGAYSDMMKQLRNHSSQLPLFQVMEFTNKASSVFERLYHCIIFVGSDHGKKLFWDCLFFGGRPWQEESPLTVSKSSGPSGSVEEVSGSPGKSQ